MSRRPTAYLVEGPKGERDLTFIALTDGDRRAGWRQTPLFAGEREPPPPPATFPTID